MISDTAIVLSAGLGTRMRPLTLETPKPLLKVHGKPMLLLAIEKLQETGIVKRIVVNTHYLASQIEDFVKTLDTKLEIIISHEKEILETGGGILNALSYFGNKPFFAINADLPWKDNGKPSLLRMTDVWNPEIMDILLLLIKTEKAMGFDSKGDFFMDSNSGFGEIYRKRTKPPRPYFFMAAQILKPELFKKPPSKVFSNGVLYDTTEEKRRLYGLEHKGSCFHVGTPEDLKKANELMDWNT